MTKVYSVSPVEDCDGGVAWFTNQESAFKVARAIASAGTTATVERETIYPGRGRDLIVNLLNRVGFSAGSEVVKVFPAKAVALP